MLRTLRCGDNQLVSCADSVDCVPDGLEVLHIHPNPVTKDKKSKYRDNVILRCPNILEIDEKDVMPRERQFLIEMTRRKIEKLEREVAGGR